jgi:hypothetical protein
VTWQGSIAASELLKYMRRLINETDKRKNVGGMELTNVLRSVLHTMFVGGGDFN